jgi:hypothetical protein
LAEQRIARAPVRAGRQGLRPAQGRARPYARARRRCSAPMATSGPLHQAQVERYRRLRRTPPPPRRRVLFRLSQIPSDRVPLWVVGSSDGPATPRGKYQVSVEDFSASAIAALQKLNYLAVRGDFRVAMPAPKRMVRGEKGGGSSAPYRHQPGSRVHPVNGRHPAHALPGLHRVHADQVGSGSLSPVL